MSASRMKKSKVRENIEAVLLALFIVAFVKVVLFENYMVPSGSMIPTISIGDRLVGLKFFYGAKIPFTRSRLPAFRDPDYGDIVIFQAPFYREPGTLVRVFNPVVYTLSLGFINLDREPKYYVKRCVGRPGDRVEVVKKQVFVNGTPQNGWWPEYHSDPSVIPAGEGSDGERDYFGPVLVPEGRYFMMGDNRDESFDSRYWGFANRDDIYGRAVFRVWPLKAFGPLR